jgi:hypothetical protein
VLLVAVDPGDHLGLGGVDPDVVRSDEPLEGADVVVVPDLLDRVVNTAMDMVVCSSVVS